jgi:hypothetical protein
MFVRVRRVGIGGFRPGAAADGAAARLCKYSMAGMGRCRRRCRVKPRCRWVIGSERQLEPYSLKLTLVENTRIDGKVRQAIIVRLGSIDATWLDSFWSAVGVDELARIRRPNWRLHSLQQRIAFWEGVLARMGRVGNNRLTAGQRKAARREIHKVVPWVMEHERKELKVLEAKREFEEGQFIHAQLEKRIALNEKQRAAIEQELVQDRKKSADFAKMLLAQGQLIAKLARGP